MRLLAAAPFVLCLWFVPAAVVPRADGTSGTPIAPLLMNLGTLHYAITTTQPRAQTFFDQGLRLIYGFNHAEAVRSFREAQRVDPQCAMCFWGEAYALGPNVNDPITAEREKQAHADTRTGTDACRTDVTTGAGLDRCAHPPLHGPTRQRSCAAGRRVHRRHEGAGRPLSRRSRDQHDLRGSRYGSAPLVGPGRRRMCQNRVSQTRSSRSSAPCGRIRITPVLTTSTFTSSRRRALPTGASRAPTSSRV